MSDDMFVVGVGASAGGLDAFERFLDRLPTSSGLAVVFVQHLAPEQESMLPEILRRSTSIPVVVAEDGLAIEPNTIYVNPPNSELTVEKGVLHSTTPQGPHYQHRPIDVFFRSLAADYRDRAVAVVLSGAGTDGAASLVHVKGEAGLVLAQKPETAAFGSMPNSAIETGLVDFALPPEKMPETIAQYKQRNIELANQPVITSPEDDGALQRILRILRMRTGNDFLQYKSSTIRRRVQRRMMINRISSVAEYAQYVQQKPDEVEALFSEMLIGVTQFFRDPPAFEALATEVLSPLVASKAMNDPLRVWVPGCSTGEEAYSIAMLIHEQIRAQERPLKVQVFATDVNHASIQKARRGFYGDGIAPDTTPDRLERYFEREGGGYRVKRAIRDMIVFAVQNALQDPPFSNVDLISCRNLMIYLEPDLQRKFIPLLHYALRPGGYLFLGSSESLSRQAYLFTTINSRARLFQRRDVPINPLPSFEFNTTPTLETDLPAKPMGRGSVRKQTRLRQIAEQQLLRRYSPSAVIVTGDGAILYFHERTGKFLEPASGEATLNVLQMAREGLRMPLSTAIRKASTQNQEVVQERVHVKIDGEFQVIDLIVRPLRDQDANADFFLVVFKEIGPVLPAEDPATQDEQEIRHQRVVELERELQLARDYLQTTIEDLEASNEELKSTNEELQSSNEELQSANEELTSAKEELQSVNEELVTVNSELESKIDLLTRANDDLRNLLASVEIGIIFLNRALEVVRFNEAAQRFVNLIEADIGRPIAHIVSNLQYDHLVADIRSVMDTLVPREMEVRADDRWYLMRVRPYRTMQDMIDGIIVTFSEITEQKSVQGELRKLSRIVDQSRSLILTLNAEGRISYANQRFSDLSGFAIAQAVGEPFGWLLADGTGDQAAHTVLETAWAGEEWRGELTYRTRSGGALRIVSRVTPLVSDDGDVTELIVLGDTTGETDDGKHL